MPNQTREVANSASRILLQQPGVSLPYKTLIRMSKEELGVYGVYENKLHLIGSKSMWVNHNSVQNLLFILPYTWWLACGKETYVPYPILIKCRLW